MQICYSHFGEKGDGEMIKHKHTEMSDRKCGCSTFIKQSVVDRMPKAKHCYECHRKEEEGMGNTISTAREVRTGKRPARKRGPYIIGSKNLGGR